MFAKPPTLSSVGALVAALLVVNSVDAAWWPFGDLGNTGLFNGFNNNNNNQQQPDQSYQQQPQSYLSAPLYIQQQQDPQPQSYLSPPVYYQQQQPQQQQPDPQTQRSSWWPFQSLRGGPNGNGASNIGNMVGNVNPNFQQALPQQGWQAPVAKINWDEIDPNTANTTEKWVQGPNGNWQLVKETVRKTDNGNGSTVQGYSVSSVYTSDKNSPDMLKKVLPQVETMSSRFGIPINIDQPQWVMSQEHSSSSSDIRNPAPAVQIQRTQVQQQTEPIVQQRPVVLQVVDNPRPATIVNSNNNNNQPWAWDNNQGRLVPVFGSQYTQQPAADIAPIRVVPVNIPQSETDSDQPVAVIRAPAAPLRTVQNTVVNLNGQPYPRPVIIDFKQPASTNLDSDNK